MVLSKCVFDFNFNGTDSISENDAVNSLLKSKFQFHHLSVAQNQQCLKLGISRRQVSDFYGRKHVLNSTEAVEFANDKRADHCEQP